MTHNDTDGFTHCDKRNAHQVPDGGFDVDRGDRVEASIGIALVDNGHAECPESLVTHERKCFYDKLTGKFARNFKAGKRAADKRELVCVCSCIDHQDRELHKTGDDGRDRGTDSAESRKPEHSVDQERVTDEVYDDRAKGGDHRDLGLAEIFQSAGICLCQTDRDKRGEHDMDVVNADVQDLCGVRRIAVSVEEQFDQERSGDHKRDDAQCRKDRIEYDLKAERVADALCVALAVILRGKDTHSGGRAEDEKIEHEDQLVGDGNAGDRVCTQITDHEIVQKVDEIRDAVLDHHRDGDHEKLLILIFIFFQCHE